MKYQNIAFLCCASCALAQNDVPEGLNGYWMSDGYGIVTEIQDGRARAYQLAGEICVPENDKWESLASLLAGTDVAPQPDGKTLLITAPFAQHSLRAQRIPSLPTACVKPPKNTPEGNFEAFAAFFEENYAFFDLYGVDWTANVNAARYEVRSNMSDTELFSLMARLMAPMKDGHLALNGRDGRDELNFEPNVGRTHSALMAAAKKSGRDYEEEVDAFHQALWMGNIQKNILQGKGELTGNRRVQYGVVDGDIGYISFITMGGYTSGGSDPERDLKTINTIMEEALHLFEETDVRAVVLDLSVNYGGFDFVSRAIAERFAEERTHAYTKYAGDADDPIRTRVMLNPSSGTRFEGPVYVVTSNVTISAGEILTMALRALPNVTHVGEPTRGALSDVLDKTLPNGWELSLSNEVYLDHRGAAWEGKGIEPDFEMTVLPDGDPAAGHLTAIRALLSEI